MRFRIASDREWATSKVAPFPVRWQGRLLNAWERERKEGQGYDFEAQRAANIRLRETADLLNTVRLPLDAWDSDICNRATELAEACFSLGGVYHMDGDLREAMARICNGNGVKPPSGKSVTVTGAIKRMTSPIWWRGQLRKVHAKAVEGSAISLGYVHKRGDLYVSNESLSREQQKNARNAAMLENTVAVNELDQEFTLAELSAKGTANKSIRRAELMTRISGFERIARDMGHGGLFLTITCPSRMHKWKTHKDGVLPNRKFDGTTPKEAQAYLCTLWKRARSKFKRDGLGIYGFRIAEPNHDGTPHWHLLVFHSSEHLEQIKEVMTHYALADSPDEAGATEHRVKYEEIDWSKGTAAGYIAKYVSKNIDGYRVDKDLHGNDTFETSARVQAWASTWGIRQFQQVGGPPVGPWRELRRVADMPEGVPDYLAQAHRAVNKLAVIEGRDNASVAWDSYCRAQGGVFCGRDYRIKVAKEEVEGEGRYGEPLAPRPVGVETVSKEFYTPAHMAHMGKVNATRLVHWFVESVRHAWVIVSKKKREIEGKFKGALRPWTCVNNCTEREHGAIEKTPNRSRFGNRKVVEGTSPHQSDGFGLHGTSFGCA